ncbi:PIR Superfamily Protein [Plasmodium ovale wallikeri]|uniref:PIR Superfamily Protein n=2 Tax=Plasmodium ovale TaxID=36330 RepID=A0A1A9AIJ4_PLAOA|nr:PIR Superfamily Protein [Plasmodium ovale wallikeri]SBT58830.1 PIR Superfamily Protein [Plasmodium ovale wallikeri]SBT73719.1 PIR protein [Plasmodium ovale]
MTITLNELPSKKFGNIWNEEICYDEVNNIITHKKGTGDAYKWLTNFGKKFKINLEKHQVNINDNTLEKRCRDLYYIIYDILYQLKNLEHYEYSTYNTIKETIKVYIRSAFINIGYASCLPDSINEADYEYANVKDKKYIDDFCEDITYIEKSVNQINSSHECNEIKVYLEEEFNKRNQTYNLKKELYAKILEYYKKNNFDSLKDIIAQIKCTTGENVQEKELLDDPETPVDSSHWHSIVAPVLSLWGFLLIFIFLYKATPFRSWFDRKIRKKIIYSNNENDEVSHKIFEESCEYPQTNPYNDEYNVLYNSVADT